MLQPPSSQSPSRRELVAGFLAALGAAGEALAAPAPGHMKSLALLVPKAGITPEVFRREWLQVHAAQAHNIPDLDGFVLSEAVPPAAKPMAGAPHLSEVLGVSTSWWKDAATRTAALATPPAKAWIAHGNTFLDRGRSLSLTLQEHVFVRPRLDGAVKRIGLMRRKPGVSHQACIDHWLNVHAPMSGAVPNLRGFVVSECVAGSSGIDGVVETWWDSIPARAAAIASPGGVAWTTDGRQFLDLDASGGLSVRDHVVIPPPAWA